MEKQGVDVNRIETSWKHRGMNNSSATAYCDCGPHFVDYPVTLPLEKNTSIVTLVVVVTVLTVTLWYVLSPSLISSSATSQATRVYFADRISDAHRLAINRFNQIHRGSIEVVPVDLPFDKFTTNERKELLARSLRSKSDKLDVFAVDLIWVRRFARWCEPLDSSFKSGDREKIIPVALQSCLYDTSLVSMPLYIDIGLMYYRQDILDRLPEARSIESDLERSISWPEFMRLRDRLKYRGKPYYVFQGNDYEGLVCNYLELVRGKDPSFLSQNRIDLQSPAARSALELLVDLVHKDRMSPAEVSEFDENLSYEYMLNNDAVFVRGWPNFVETFRKSYRDSAKLASIRKSALPHFPGQPPTSVIGGWNLMLSKYSTRKAAALEFIRFVQTKEAQQLLYETEGFLPVTKDIYQDSVYMRSHPDLAYYYTLLQHGFHRPAMVDYTRISDIVSYYVHRAIRKELTVPEALRGASEMINSNKVLIK
jgi:multiple sugar transport system substrate-binding protein